MLSRAEALRLGRDAGFIIGRDASGEFVAPQYTDAVGTLERLVNAAYAAGQAAEREECAKAADRFGLNPPWVLGSIYKRVGEELAAAIRARGEKGGA